MLGTAEEPRGQCGWCPVHDLGLCGGRGTPRMGRGFCEGPAAPARICTLFGENQEARQNLKQGPDTHGLIKL